MPESCHKAHTKARAAHTGTRACIQYVIQIKHLQNIRPAGTRRNGRGEKNPGKHIKFWATAHSGETLLKLPAISAGTTSQPSRHCWRIRTDTHACSIQTENTSRSRKHEKTYTPPWSCQRLGQQTARVMTANDRTGTLAVHTASQCNLRNTKKTYQRMQQL